jgi:phospholipid/cholesterol/gamma-HCH transport system substrate-binding protein
MKKGTNDLIVGATVLLAAVAIVVATLWVQQADIGQRQANIEARFRDVGNARVGSAVVIRGVQSGRIESIELRDEGWVHMRLRLNEDVILPQNPVVFLSSSSLFGEWQATITSREALPNNPDVQRQVAEAAGVPDILPGASVPDIAQLTAVAGGIADNVASVADRFRIAFDSAAAFELRASIGNVAQLSEELERTVRRQSRNLDTVAVAVRISMDELRAAAAALRRVSSRVDSSTASGEIEAIARNISRSAAQLEVTSARVQELATRMQATQANLDRLLARSDSVVGKVNAGTGSLGLMLNDPSLYRQTDSLITELRQLVTDMRANPRKYINLRIF